jgi:hypothetical protein
VLPQLNQFRRQHRPVDGVVNGEAPWSAVTCHRFGF